MSLNRHRLDRFLSNSQHINRKDVRRYLAQGRVMVDGTKASDISLIVNTFSHITLDGEVIQDNPPHYVMLHKPVGVVSATRDNQHKTVVDCLSHPAPSTLHIVGRLDLNTSGLLLLTNDSRWSAKLTDPQHKVAKRYRVTLQKPVTSDYIQAFAEGMYFPFENLTTQPADLKILSPFVVEVTLYEGRYHQIKRMFGRFRNQVIALHRLSVGHIKLCPALQPGQSRDLTSLERSIPESITCP